jgi:hypothetical protein
MSRFLKTLAERVVIYDGAMGTNIQFRLRSVPGTSWYTTPAQSIL